MDDVPFFSDEFLNEYELPIGDWAESAINWLATQLTWLWDLIIAPVNWLLGLVIEDILLGVSWFVVVLAFLAIGWARRGLKVGLGAAVGLVVCGLLGNDFWEETMETLGMIIVAVMICVVIGLPLGILAARSEVANAIIRPVLDAMQTIHPFVYLLPIVFLFGTGRTPGVLATIIFAMPPIVRLTNLGIRSVPSDVVEAGKAFGGSGRQLLRDVQLPLARPSIMAGLNQTLMLALSMVVIVALIAGPGLGRLILRGVNTANIPLAVTSGLAVLILAVVLDRISTVSDNDVEPGIRSSLRRIFGVFGRRRDSLEVEALASVNAATQSGTDAASVDEHLASEIGASRT
jgi:glycine betaine/proline transport system permease protein